MGWGVRNIHHFLGYTGTIILTKGHSWTFRDPQMDPATQSLGDPDPIKAFQDPFKVGIDHFI